MIDAPCPANPDDCRRRIESGLKYPFDGVWKADELQPLRDAADASYQAARGILCDFEDRRGIRQALRGIDQDVREEIIDTVAMIIREAANRPLPVKPVEGDF